jgi:hypothetical protein
MELSFTDVSRADASYLAQELELALLKEGVPADVLSLKRTSPENMDAGSTLWVAVETASHIIGAVGYIACFVKCIYEVATKHDATIVVLTKHGEVKIPASEISEDLIEQALTKRRRAHAKTKSKSRAKIRAKA